MNDIGKEPPLNPPEPRHNLTPDELLELAASGDTYYTALLLEAYMYETNQAKLLRWLIRNGSEEIQLELAAAARGVLEG